LKYLRDAERRFESFNVPWHENVINVKVFKSKAAQYYGVDSAQYHLDEAFKSASLAKTCIAMECILDSLFISAQALSIFEAQIALIPLKHSGHPVAAANEFDLWVERYETTTAQYLGQLRSGSGIRLVARTNETVFNAGVRMHYRAWLQSPDAMHLDRMLTYSTKGKALTLRLRSNNRKIQNYANVPDTLLAEEQSYITQIEVKRQQMLQDSSLESRSAYSNALEAYQVFKSKIRREHPKYYALKYDLGVPSLEVLQRKLKPSERYLEFALVDTALIAMIIDRDAFDVKSFSVATIRPLVTAYTAAVQSRDHNVHQRASRDLYNTLVRELLPDEGISKLIIGPDEFLYEVSFESIWLENSKQYLIQQYVISYAPSADAWIDQVAIPSLGKKRILDFSPGFEKTLKERYLENRDSSAIDSNYLALLSQPFMIMLSETLAKDLGSTSFRGELATESSYKENAGSYQLLHLGTHASLNNNNPLYSRLVLAKDSLDNEDGYLYTYEIYGIPVQAELAVLTACETGGGEFQSGQGIESLAHAFAYAGCPSMIMSLWSIDEKSTAEIMQLFYRHIRDDPSVSVALANAKREYLTNAPHELRHPYYWSGLVLMGSDGVVRLGDKTHWWLWGAGIFMLALVTRWIVLQRSKNAGIRN
jgi:CHAT domain-containing protein